MEERCRACVILGGDEEPCISRLEIETRYKPMGKECPRETLDPSCVESASLISVALNSDLRTYGMAFWASETAHMDREGKDLVLGQIRAVLGDRDVQALLHPPLSLPTEE